ncbi:hypothetical protein [Epibacterium ulvae]|uniref:hypothetical protein n=1 Tax=Epibacterium ulvae TaxID=1156985 RepID=UPI002491D599|nr:hypothetical protein [Epibacterium ulvae]
MLKLPFANRIPVARLQSNLVAERLTASLLAKFSKRQRSPAIRHSTETSIFDETGPDDAGLRINIRDIDKDEHDASQARERGLFLARQDRWEDLVQELEQAEHARTTTASGQPISDLIAFGARGDVVNAVEHALSENHRTDDRALIQGVMALESARLDLGQPALMTALVALTHIDLGWIWRSKTGAHYCARTHKQRAQRHFSRAASLLTPLEGEPLNSPLIAAAKCALYPHVPAPALEVADAYAALIDLAPENNRHMRALGTALLPQQADGSWDTLELEARRTAARTESIWGMGGYTWVYFDALLCDAQAASQLDVSLFVEGLQDILAKDPNQATINLITAYCGIAAKRSLEEEPAGAELRTELSDMAEWLARNRLCEIHPLTWAHASKGFANNVPDTSLARFASRGKDAARHYLADLFASELCSGQTVTYTPAGVELAAG